MSYEVGASMSYVSQGIYVLCVTGHLCPMCRRASMSYVSRGIYVLCVSWHLCPMCLGASMSYVPRGIYVLCVTGHLCPMITEVGASMSYVPRGIYVLWTHTSIFLLIYCRPEKQSKLQEIPGSVKIILKKLSPDDMLQS